MLRYDQRDKKKAARLFLKRIVLMLLCTVVAGASWGVWGVYQKERESRVMRVEHEQELKDLIARKGALEEKIETLKTAQGKATMLREEFGLAAAGENVIVIVDPTQSETHASSSIAQKDWLHKLIPWW